MKLARYTKIPFADKWKPGCYDEASNPEQYALRHLVKQLFSQLDEEDQTYVSDTLLEAAKSFVEDHARSYVHMMHDE